MRHALRSVPFVLLLSLLLLPVAAGAFTLSLPADSAVTIGSPSRLQFTVTNTDASEGLSRLVLRFPSGYRVTGGSALAGWTVEQSPNPAGESAEISFRTTDEVKCTGALAPGSSLVFGVEVIALASRSVTPDALASAQAEQSCRGVLLDPPATLPSWDRLGIETALAAGPSTIGVGGTVTVTMTVTNLSTIELTDISALLSSAGTGSASGLAGPSPGNLTLAPGASGSLTWTARAASAGTLSFSGQAVAVAKNVTSPPIGSDTLFVGDLDVSLSITPEQVVSGQGVQVQMTVTNRGPVRVANVTPSSLTFDGTATASAPAGPGPASQPGLEPGEFTTFAWAATVSGNGGDTYAFSGWASAESGAVLSASVTSNRGTLTQQDAGSATRSADASGGSLLLGGGSGAGSATGGAAAVTTGGGTATAVTTGGGTATVLLSAPPSTLPIVTLQFIGVNQDGSLTGGAQFLSGILRDLRIRVGWQNLSGSHTQRLELFSPDGSLYQRFSTQFANASSVETDLPVGGTWITEFSLFGAWRVDVFLDSQRMPITSAAFLLTP